MPQSPTLSSPGGRSLPELTKPLVLVGLMGVGKSTVGRRLAAKLGLPFVDADEEIEKASGMSVSELFEEYGEQQFRDGERRVIARLMDGQVKVIATGGGAFIEPETRALILKEGIAIWLNADVEVLAERVSRRSTRPLLKNRNASEVLARLAGERDRYYAEAPIHVQSGEGMHEDTVERILDALAQ